MDNLNVEIIQSTDFSVAWANLEAVIYLRLGLWTTPVVCACRISKNQLLSSSNWIPSGDAGRKSFPPFYGVNNPETQGEMVTCPWTE